MSLAAHAVPHVQAVFSGGVENGGHILHASVFAFTSFVSEFVGRQQPVRCTIMCVTVVFLPFAEQISRGRVELLIGGNLLCTRMHSHFQLNGLLR